MLKTENADGTTTFHPTDPNNSGYREALVERLANSSFKSDDEFYDALKAEHENVVASAQLVMAESMKGASGAVQRSKRSK
jgi:hypothetical protein